MRRSIRQLRGSLLRHVRYARYVLRHRWFVLVESCRLGVSWLGVVHDLSKFRPSEWMPYARHFFDDEGEPRGKTRDKTGYYKPHDTGDPAFEYAWFLHQKRNKHHWQWWVMPRDRAPLEAPVKVLPMPDRYRREMLADWRGAGRAQGRPDTAGWYEANGGKIHLHPTTRDWIERQLGTLCLAAGAVEG